MKTRSLWMVFISLLILSCERKNETPEYNGLNFTLFQNSGMQSGLVLGENIVNYNEVIAYDSTTHTFLLNDRAKERILANSTSTFAVTTDGVIIYIANFIPGYSSTSCDQCIRIEPFSPGNRYRVELGYPGGSGLFTGVDARNDSRIIECLKKDNKLIEIQAK